MSPLGAVIWYFEFIGWLMLAGLAITIAVMPFWIVGRMLGWIE